MKVEAFIRGPSTRHPEPNSRVLALARACNAKIRQRDEGIVGDPDFIIHAAIKPWKSKAIRDAIARNIPVLVAEHGYFGSRLHNMSLGWNGINNRAIRPDPLPKPRPEPFLHRWKPIKRVKNILLPLQVLNDASLEGVDIADWARKSEKSLKQRYPDAIIHIRPHPATYLFEATRPMPPIKDILRNYDLVHTFSSNVGVDAICMGVPATASSPMSMIWDVQDWGTHTPDREYWVHNLGYCQWSEDESGEAIKFMLRALPEAREMGFENLYVPKEAV